MLDVAWNFNGKLEDCAGSGFEAVSAHKIKLDLKYMFQLSSDIKTAVL